MKLIKKSKKKIIVQDLEAIFSRGMIYTTDKKLLYMLNIDAHIGEDGEDYVEYDWTKEDLQDLADALNAFIKELK